MGSIKIDPYALGFAPRLLAAAVSLSFVGGGGGLPASLLIFLAPKVRRRPRIAALKHKAAENATPSNLLWNGIGLGHPGP